MIGDKVEPCYFESGYLISPALLSPFSMPLFFFSLVFFSLIYYQLSWTPTFSNCFYFPFKLITIWWAWEMVPRGLVGAWHYWRQSREVSLATKQAVEPPLCAATNSHFYNDSVSGTPTYLIHFLPKPKPTKRVGGVGSRFHNASPSELCNNLLQFAVEALAWSLNDSWYSMSANPQW